MSVASLTSKSIAACSSSKHLPSSEIKEKEESILSGKGRKILELLETVKKEVKEGKWGESAAHLLEARQLAQTLDDPYAVANLLESLDGEMLREIGTESGNKGVQKMVDEKDSIRLVFEEILQEICRDSPDGGRPTIFVCHSIEEGVSKWLRETFLYDLDLVGMRPVCSGWQLSGSISKFERFVKMTDKILVVGTPQARKKCESKMLKPDGMAKELKMAEKRYNRSDKTLELIYQLYLKGEPEETCCSRHFGKLFGNKMTVLGNSTDGNFLSYYLPALEFFGTIRGFLRLESIEGFGAEFFSQIKMILGGTIDKDRLITWRLEKGKVRALVPVRAKETFSELSKKLASGFTLVPETRDFSRIVACAIRTLKKGSQDKYAYLRLVSITEGAVSVRLWDDFIKTCFISIDKGWDSKFAVVIALGGFLKEERLSPEQQKRFVELGIQSIREGWQSQHIFTVTLDKFRERLTADQKVDFGDTCNTHKEELAICRVVTEGEPIAAITEKAIATLDKGSQDKYAYLRLAFTGGISREAVPELWGKFIQICFTSIREKWDSQYVVVRTLGDLAQKGRFSPSEQQQFVDLWKESIYNGWDNKYIFTITLHEMRGQLKRSQRKTFKACCAESIRRGFDSAPICEIVISR